MCQFIETLKIENGSICNTELHNARMNRTRRKFFDSKDELFVEDFIDPGEMHEHSTVKCTVSYDDRIRNCRYVPYTKRRIESLGLVYCDDIDYTFKYADRSALEELRKRQPECDEIIIVKNGLVTDSSFANLVFFDGRNYITPASPLLYGTKRDALLEKDLIIEKEIIPEDLPGFRHAGLINALLDPGDYKIENIRYS